MTVSYLALSFACAHIHHGSKNDQTYDPFAQIDVEFKHDYPFSEDRRLSYTCTTADAECGTWCTDSSSCYQVINQLSLDYLFLFGPSFTNIIFRLRAAQIATTAKAPLGTCAVTVRLVVLPPPLLHRIRQHQPYWSIIGGPRLVIRTQ